MLYCNSDECELADELYITMKNSGLTDLFSEIGLYKPGWADLETRDTLERATGEDTWTADAEPWNDAEDADDQP